MKDGKSHEKRTNNTQETDTSADNEPTTTQSIETSNEEEVPLHIPKKPAFAGGNIKNEDNKPEQVQEEDSIQQDNSKLKQTQEDDSVKANDNKPEQVQEGGNAKVEEDKPEQVQETVTEKENENMLSIDYLEKIKSHKCNCVFWRDKGVSDFTCLIEDEIKHLQKLAPLSKNISDVTEWYKALVEQLGCQNTSNWDQCVLAKQFRNNPQAIAIYENAIPTVQKEFRDQWLTSIDIDRLLYGLERNIPIYKYMGMACWDEFEDQATNLNIDTIIQTIKQYPEKRVFGWVLNQCHKYSPGKHWVAMTFVKDPKINKFKVYYYDSQGYTGPNSENIIDCEIHMSESDPKYEKYCHYQSHFNEWWDQLLKHHDIIDNHHLPLFNNFETQGDNYSCGYHAIFFNFLCAKFAEDHKQFTPNSLALKILGNVRDTQLGKALDKYIKLF